MKKFTKILSALLILCTLLACFVGCDLLVKEEPTEEPSGDQPKPEWVDHVSQLKLDMDSETAKVIDPEIKQFIDGDTTHFYVPTSVSENGVLKARYLAINTPESTGKIEEWGKRASRFTKEKLQSATSIVIESDTASWNVDSTGDRYLVWIWYKTAEDQEYRNLNLEILQEGLAIASNSSQNRYGEICMSAINQAEIYELFVYSDDIDEDFYYGEAIELNIQELRIDAEKYNGKKVAFEGIVSKNSGNNGVYIEAWNEETQMYNAIYVYYGFGFSGLKILKPGNKVRIVGSMQYYEAGGTYQIADIKTSYDPKDPNAIQLIESGHSAAYVETSADTFVNGVLDVTVIDEEGNETVIQRKYADLAMSTTLSMKDLTVDSIYVTNNGGDSDGAMTLTCKSADGITVAVRTDVLYDEDNNLITSDYFQGKTIDVKGTVDYFDGDYQIKVTSINDINIH